jgi:uncharacterized protein (DUF1499 family)
VVKDMRMLLKRRKIMLILIPVVAIVAVLAGSMMIQNLATPKGLGVIDGRLSEVPKSPNAVSSQTLQSDKLVEPLPFRENLSESKSVIKSILSTYPNAVVHVEDANYLHVIVTTSGMRFKDDVEFYFDEQNRVIHYRSASRTGYSDMGLNLKRYQELFSLYENHSIAK